MSTAYVTRICVVAEYSDGMVRRVSCDHPAAAQFDVSYQPACYPRSYQQPVTSLFSGPPEFRLEVAPGRGPLVMEVVEGAAIARARAVQCTATVSEYANGAMAGVLEHARKRAREQLAIATLDAGCVMLALPGETTTPGRFGETVLEVTVPVAPAA
jgi:hypothetical protein